MVKEKDIKSVSSNFPIITVGLSPAWDITCRGQGLDWGLHKEIDEQTVQPAGKALNVSKALAWMGQKNIAAGLWGQQDYQQMLAAVRFQCPFIKVRMTLAAGSTRQNITIVDTANNRDIHLRSKSALASRRTLKNLDADLQRIVSRNSVCVFAGAMPDNELLPDIIGIIKSCRKLGAKIVLDTSGAALREVVDTGNVWLIKPNVSELRHLLGEQVADKPVSLVKAGQKLLDKIEIVLISRGEKGAVVVSRNGAWQARCTARRQILSTVGCGDYLLAGFLKGLKDKANIGLALQSAIKAATAKAWGWVEKKKWLQTQRQIKVHIKEIFV